MFAFITSHNMYNINLMKRIIKNEELKTEMKTLLSQLSLYNSSKDKIEYIDRCTQTLCRSPLTKEKCVQTENTLCHEKNIQTDDLDDFEMA